MSFKHIGTAADLVRYGASLRIECTGCGAARTLTGAEVVKRCGAGPLPAIRARLKCERCNMRRRAAHRTAAGLTLTLATTAPLS